MCFCQLQRYMHAKLSKKRTPACKMLSPSFLFTLPYRVSVHSVCYGISFLSWNLYHNHDIWICFPSSDGGAVRSDWFYFFYHVWNISYKRYEYSPGSDRHQFIVSTWPACTPRKHKWNLVDVCVWADWGHCVAMRHSEMQWLLILRWYIAITFQTDFGILYSRYCINASLGMHQAHTQQTHNIITTYLLCQNV